MSKQFLSKMLSLVFLLSIFIPAIYMNLSKPRVMIVQSYHPDYAWTRETDIGLKRVVDSWTDYSVTWHYMDTKRINGKEWLDRSGLITKRAIDQTDPNVLIAVDDFAQDLVAKHYVNSSKMNIVFAGVNGSVDAYNYNNAKNVTGIFEHKLLVPIQEVILTIEQKKSLPKLNPKLLYLMDPSDSLKQGRVSIDNFAWAPIQYFGSIIANDFEHWQKLVLSIGKKVDYIIVSNYRKLPRNKEQQVFVNPHEVMQWTEAHSPVPVIGINSFNVEDGAMISVGASPYEQGEVAAKMANKIIKENISANQIPFQQNKMYIIALRKEALLKRHIQLPSIYEAFGRATENFIEN